MDFTLLIVIIVLALIFDYINGFHDAANAIATVVATKVLTPFQAVVWAAFFNFLAYWVFGFGGVRNRVFLRRKGVDTHFGEFLQFFSADNFLFG